MIRAWNRVPLACKAYPSACGGPNTCRWAPCGPSTRRWYSGGQQHETGNPSIPLYGALGIIAGSLTTFLVMRGVYGDVPTQPSPVKSQTAGSKYADLPTMRKAVSEIRQSLGEDSVSEDAAVIEAHGHSEWSTSNTSARPVAVVMPRSTEDVSAIARICTRHRVPMVPFGAGSSVEGNFASPHSGVCVDFSRMDRVLAFHEDDMDVVVQPGVNWVELNHQIEGSKLFLPMDPSPTALIGGMVATNCSGTNALRYGTMKDWVLSLTVVLADGSVLKTRGRPRKTSAGYNLNGLFAGSEGTLGMITEITLKLAVVPSNFGVAMATFPTLQDAAAAASGMIRKGIPLAALELMDDTQMKIVNQNGGAGGRMWAELPTLFIKFSGAEAAIRDSKESASGIARAHSCGDFYFATDEAKMQDLWSARKVALWASLAVRPKGTEIWSTDVAVPLSRMAEIMENCKEKASGLGLFNSFLGHVGDGNFHQMVMYHPDRPDEVRAVKQCVDEMMVRAVEMEGTVSGEHGIGLGKKRSLEKELDPETIAVMRALKRSLDPHWLLNPGKVFDEE